MAETLEQVEKKHFSTPDEQRTFDKGKVDVVNLGEVTFGRATLQPGWKWSTCVKPIAKTDFCEASHLQFQLSGRLHVRWQMDTNSTSLLAMSSKFHRDTMPG